MSSADVYRGKKLWCVQDPKKEVYEQIIIDGLNHALDTLTKDQAIVFVIRHGKAGNNQHQEDYGHQLCDDYIAHGDYLADPELENIGKQQAQLTGEWLHGLLVEKLKIHDVRTIPFYTSSLDRCVATAKIVATCICKDEKEYKPKLTLFDSLREWVGWEHNSNTDKRSTKAEILARYQPSSETAWELAFQANFSENDDMFNQSPLTETWTAVGKRWMKGLASALTELGESPRISPRICLLVGNNRSIQCGLRELKLKVDEDMMKISKPPGKLIVEDMNNAAVMALLVNRDSFKLDADGMLTREREWEAMDKDDRKKIKDLREREKKESLAQLKSVLEGPKCEDFLKIVPKERMDKIREDLGSIVLTDAKKVEVLGAMKSANKLT